MEFNVLNYGAKGDGLTNDTAAIQKALDAAYNAGGGTVVIPNGTFIVKGNGDASDGCLQIRDNVTLTGAGMGETIIKLQDNYNHKVTGIIRTPASEVTKNVTVEKLTIDGNMQNNRGEVDGVFCGVEPGDPRADENITFQNMEIHSVSRYAFDPHEITKNLVIRDTVAHHNGFDGYVADFQMDGIFENNIAYANGRHGFNIVTGTVGFTAKNLIAYDNGSNGIVVQRGSDLREWTREVNIIGGKYYNNGGEGVLVKISKDVTVTGVESFSNGTYGIRVMGSDGVSVYGNTVHDNSVRKAGADEIRVEQYDDTLGATKKIWGSQDVFVALNNIYSETGMSAYGVRVLNDASSNIHVGENMITGIARGETWFGANTDTNISGMEILPPEEERPTDPGIDMSQFIKIVYGDDTAESILGSDGKDYIYGGGGEDTIVSGNGHDMLKGGLGDDNIRSGAGNDNLEGNGGNDYLESGIGDDTLKGGEGDDSLLAGSGNDVLYGEKGNDYISAFDGDDSLNGGEGNDNMRGGEGNDTLVGAPGSDTMYGGGGADRFVMQNSASVEFIGDFENGIDKIDFSQFNFTDLNDMITKTTITSARGLTTITLDSDTSVLVKGLALSDITSDDFVF